MARSNVTFSIYLYEMRHEVDQAKKTKDFPNRLLFEWSHKDICMTVARLGGLINQLYRSKQTVAIEDAAGLLGTSISHTAASTSVTGFTGLVADAWIGGSIIAVDSDIIYAGMITDNDGTTLTLSDGSSIPALVSVTVILSANNSKYSADLSGLSMIQSAEPVWEVLDANGQPIEPIDIEEARNISNDIMHADEAYFYVQGQTLAIAAGTEKTLSGNLTVGVYSLPVKGTLLTDYVDLPVEYQDLAQQATMARVLRKLGRIEQAARYEAETEREWAKIEKSLLEAKPIDQATGERSK